MIFLVIGLVGLLTGFGLSWWFEELSAFERKVLQYPAISVSSRCVHCATLMFVTAALFGSLAWAEHVAGVLDTPEVQPSAFGREWRLYFHLTLLGLLIVATAIDFDCYMIPDQITVPGMLLGLLGSVAFADLQVCHLWVDWSVAIPQLRGPGIPAWYDAHKHWHALAWSSAGLATGAVLTWLARAVSSRVLGQEAMGFGDVTLMAMIGSFLGWQPMVFVFLLAPFCGIFVGLIVKTMINRSYVPYGPYLSAAALLVMFFWKWIWQWEPTPRVSIRKLFGDLPSLAILAGVSFVLLSVLLGIARWWRGTTLPPLEFPAHASDDEELPTP